MTEPLLQKYNKLRLDQAELQKAMKRSYDSLIQNHYSIFLNSFNDFSVEFSEYQKAILKVFAIPFRMALELNPPAKTHSRYKISLRTDIQEFSQPLVQQMLAEECAKRCLEEDIEFDYIWIERAERYGAYDITFYIL